MGNGDFKEKLIRAINRKNYQVYKEASSFSSPFKVVFLHVVAESARPINN